MRRIYRRGETRPTESANSNVRGPNSALTEFLSEQNIRAQVIRDRYLSRLRDAAGSDNENPEEMEAAADAAEEAVEAAETAARTVLEEESDDEIVEIVDESEHEPEEVEDEDEDGEPILRTSRARSAAKRKSKAASSTNGKKKQKLTKKQQKALAKKQQRGDDDDDDYSSDSSDYGRRLGLYQNDENDEELFRRRHGHRGRLPGQTDFCAQCHCKFIVTVYSESAPQEIQEKYVKEQQMKKLVEKQHRDQAKLEERLRRQAEGEDIESEPEEEEPESTEDERISGTLLLCLACSKEKLNKSKGSRSLNAQKEARESSKMYRRRVAAALLDRKDFANVSSLQEMCIQVITNYIEDVEALGSLGFYNRDRIARILSRNRKLTSQTARLFLDPSVKRLELWDCSQINADTLDLITAYCPNLESLTLSMCGQLRSDFLSRCAKNLPHLTEVALDGAFLVSGDAWATFFVDMGSRLRKLDLRNSHRFNSESLAVLVEACGSSLTHLTLHRMSGLTDPAGYMLLPGLTNLVHLDLSFPPQQVVLAKDAELITDETVIAILNAVGAQLETLVLDGCSELTDKFITDGLRPCCSPLRLQNLSIAQLDQLTDEAVADMFCAWQAQLERQSHNPLLASISLERCIGLGDTAVGAMFELVRPSAVRININSLDLTTAPFESVFLGEDRAPFAALTSFNAGFIRALTNELITAITSKSPHLEFIEVFGSPGVNKHCVVRPGVKLIGRQDALDL
ncbi:uncharacterized protein SAPINGB_P002909 [Magnusiomyces paraingens]|uniref:DNA repair protein rhp7 treble clef domain-containing protein n=1 Tax=Magnusiomyces paraingens TaxID=2606893 RepID=A0A5E8BMX8_9ASCO|nr:uncharacterized protein SAPINGB_P002909 [Saprochaete ingens]VVT50875.1 unnamed protein product [Saprochaete ingens]